MQQDEQAIRQLIACWISASQAGDTEKVLGLMADDAVFLMPGQAPMRGKAAYAAGQKALSRVDIEGRSEVQEIKVFGEWAYCWTQLAVAVTPRAGGATVKRSGHTLSVLHKQNGARVIVRDANMLAVVP